MTIRVRYRDRQPHGWWVLPEGPLSRHPDRGWVRTLDEARKEIDEHLSTGRCLFVKDGRWLGVMPRPGGNDEASVEVKRSSYDLVLLQGFSAWCVGRQGRAHEPCTTATCPCDCHGAPMQATREGG